MNQAAQTRVGPYILVKRLGAGAMGEVYLGQDTRLARRVALKCLLPNREDSKQYTRILHEARAAAQINHSNVATIYDVIEEESRAYIVMEYVEGESLAARLRRGRIPLREVVSIGRQLLSALAAAHAVGVVHRDLKPANIQLTRSGAVKILDFGIARATAPLLASSSAITQSGHPELESREHRAGTPAYMAPEQMLGTATDYRSDLYSLGVVLFELSTGKRPYDYVDPIELLDLPKTLAPRASDVDNSVPADLADALDTALKCNPENRYQSASEFDEALAAVQARLFTVRHPTRRELIALTGAAGIVGAFLWRGFSKSAGVSSAARSIGVLPFVNLSGNPAQEYLVDGLTDGLINALGRISSLSVLARTSVMAFKGVKKSISEIARELKADFIVEGSVSLTTNGTDIVRVAVNVIDPASQSQRWSTALERNLGTVSTVYPELARSIAQSIRVTPTNDEQRRLSTIGQPVDPETEKLYLLGRHEWNGRTVPQLQRALKYFRDATERRENYALAYAGLADTYVLLTGDFGVIPRDEGAAATIANASRALSIDPTLADAYTSLAFANFFLRWDFAAAAQQFKRALDLNPSYALAHQWYGNYLSDMGREEEALAELRRASDLDPLAPIISRDLAWPLFFSRRYTDAIQQLDMTLAAFPEYLPAERLRARALAQRGDRAEAIRLFEQQKLRADNARARCELAWAYALDGRRDDATAELQSAQQLNAGIYPYDIALVHTALNRPDDALAALERAFQERDPTMVNLKHDPRFDSLRSDPRYQRLVAQMRFP